MGMELLSPIGEYYIQLSYYSLIAIFQKAGRRVAAVKRLPVHQP